MHYLVLDTSVLVHCTLVNLGDADPELLEALFNAADTNGVTVLLPDPVVLEYRRKVPEELQAISAQSKALIEHLKNVGLPGPDRTELFETMQTLAAKRKKAVVTAREYFDRQLDKPGRVRLPLTGDAVASAVCTVLAGSRPSHGPNSQGLLNADSLIVACLEEYANDAGLSESDVLILCSTNFNDFATWDKDQKLHVIHPDIQSRFSCPVRFYKDPRSLLNAELSVDVAADQQLSEALDEYENAERARSQREKLDRALAEMRRNRDELAASIAASGIDVSALRNQSRLQSVAARVAEMSPDLGPLDSIQGVLDKTAAAYALGDTALAARYKDMLANLVTQPYGIEPSVARALSPELIEAYRKGATALPTDEADSLGD